MIEFRDVAVCYKPDARHPVSALNGVSLTLAAGAWAFVVGPSGAGKSTLLRLVYAGARATGGLVSVDGEDITNLPRREIPRLRRKIGVVFQDFQLLEQKTVWENVAFALQVIGAPQKRIVRDVPEALETVGLTYRSKAYPRELSGGEQQRVAIARAIVNDPLILLADEPTGNLDPQTAQDIASVLRRINDRGTTVLMATHDRAVVDAMARRVVRVEGGRVVSDEAVGTYDVDDSLDEAAVVAPLLDDVPLARGRARTERAVRDQPLRDQGVRDTALAAARELAAQDGEVQPAEEPIGSPGNPIVQFEPVGKDR